MRKLMFLTMVFGLMMVFSGSAAAQKGVVNSGDTKVEVGARITLINAYQENGKEYCVLSIRQGSDIVSVFMDRTCTQLKFEGGSYKVTKILNPNSGAIMENDTVILNTYNKVLSFSRAGSGLILRIVIEEE